jgi:hypothetical protein
MRTRVGVPNASAAPRYKTVASEDAARLAAHDDRRAEAARVEAAKFFYDLRRGLRLARVAVASRIGTEPAIVEALETGTLDALPPWPETLHVVSNYAQLVGMDPRPVLHALHVAIAHHHRKRAAESWMQRLQRKFTAGLLSDDRHHRRSRTLKWAAGIGAPAVLAGSLMLTSGLQASQLPHPLASMFGFEQQSRAKAIRRLEGMVWIDAVDPRQRRGDKLPGTTR